MKTSDVKHDHKMLKMQNERIQEMQQSMGKSIKVGKQEYILTGCNFACSDPCSHIMDQIALNLEIKR